MTKEEHEAVVTTMQELINRLEEDKKCKDEIITTQMDLHNKQVDRANALQRQNTDLANSLVSAKAEISTLKDQLMFMERTNAHLRGFIDHTQYEEARRFYEANPHLPTRFPHQQQHNSILSYTTNNGAMGDESYSPVHKWWKSQ